MPDLFGSTRRTIATDEPRKGETCCARACYSPADIVIVIADQIYRRKGSRPAKACQRETRKAYCSVHLARGIGKARNNGTTQEAQE
jgi:hypothetical protein